MQKSDNHLDVDMSMIRIQALEWVQGIFGIDNVTTDCPVYDDDYICLERQIIIIIIIIYCFLHSPQGLSFLANVILCWRHSSR